MYDILKAIINVCLLQQCCCASTCIHHHPVFLLQTRQPSRPEELHLLAESERRRHGVRRARRRHVQSAPQEPVIFRCAGPARLSVVLHGPIFAN